MRLATLFLVLRFSDCSLLPLNVNDYSDLIDVSSVGRQFRYFKFDLKLPAGFETNADGDGSGTGYDLLLTL